MRIIVPEDIDREIRVLPDGVYEATLDRIFYGTSGKGFPKATVRWISTSENGGEGEDTTVGEPILDTYSLQPQALWRLNGLYKTFAGENLPQGDYSPEEFVEILEEHLQGVEARLVVERELVEGREISKVQQVAKA